MNCREITDKIEQVYPKSAALGFDNVGLQAGRAEKEVKKIYLALDATDEVIRNAIAWNADMLITHHPLIFSPLKAVTDEDFVSRRILTMIRQDISYYAMHTNYDVLGMASLAEKKMCLQNTEVLDVTAEICGKPEGIGRIGTLQRSMTLRECCEYTKDCLGVEKIKVFGEQDRQIERLAISPGSGKSAVMPAIEKGADVLVTGDIGHHDGLNALEQGLCIIDAGHYGTEYMFLEDMESFFKRYCPEVCVKAEERKIPFQII